MTAAMGCVCRALFVQRRCRIVLAEGGNRQALTQAGVPPPGLQKTAPNIAIRRLVRDGQGVSDAKLTDGKRWFIKTEPIRRRGLVSRVWQVKKKHFHCGVKIRMVNLGGDWELRRLSGHRNLCRPAQADWRLGCGRFLCKGQCRTGVECLGKSTGEFSSGILVWLHLYPTDLSSQTEKQTNSDQIL